MVQNSVGEPEILCNNRGVDFIEGFVDIELRNLNLYRVDETIGCKLVPKNKNGVLTIQVCKITLALEILGYPKIH